MHNGFFLDFHRLYFVLEQFDIRAYCIQYISNCSLFLVARKNYFYLCKILSTNSIYLHAVCIVRHLFLEQICLEAVPLKVQSEPIVTAMARNCVQAGNKRQAITIFYNHEFTDPVIVFRCVYKHDITTVEMSFLWRDSLILRNGIIFFRGVDIIAFVCMNIPVVKIKIPFIRQFVS